VTSLVSSAPSLVGKPTIDLLIADDTPMNCQLLKTVFTRPRSCVRVVACAVSLSEIFGAMQSRCVDIALINESLQDGPLTGFRVLTELRKAFTRTRLIVLLKSATEDLVIDAFRAGARGVFCRAEALDALSKCVNVVHEGQIWANSRQLSAVLDAFVGAAPLRLVNSRGRALLTKREDEVVKCVVEGQTNREVAVKLGLTEHTVSNYLFRIYEKLGISGRVELVLYSLKSSQA
jgi:two-component system nitrate/nitrite response regulator NarL